VKQGFGFKEGHNFYILSQVNRTTAMSMRWIKGILGLMLLLSAIGGQTQNSTIAFTVGMSNPASHVFQVKMECQGLGNLPLVFKMPIWSPGYYQRMDFGQNVQHFSAKDGQGAALTWEMTDDHTWKVQPHAGSPVVMEYDVKTVSSFVGMPYLDEGRGYILPAGVLMYPAGRIEHPSELQVVPFGNWKDIATGLEPIPGKPFAFRAPNFDVLYDSPLLVGNLDELPPFFVQGKKHRFIGYQLGEFDKAKLMSDLQKIVQTAVDMMGDLPYNEYTFIGIGPGGGGIEHLNSTAFAFVAKSQSTPQTRLRNLFFLAHEYFHHYNVKRIRPIELGPFDYDKGSRTNQLWVSEGLSVYYEYMLVRRAGLCSDEELLKAFSNNIRAFEDKPGRLHQTLLQASTETWSDGPNGRVDDEVNNTISYYEKGPVVGLLLDFRIREASQNKHSLDDVMRYLYQEYYQKLQRGFTEEEFRQVCEKMAGTSLEDIFRYVSTTADLDYAKYLHYGGIQIDLERKAVPGGWLGVTTRVVWDSTVISAVEYQSPAWEAGLRRGNILLDVDNLATKQFLFNNILPQQHPGEEMDILVLQNGKQRYINLSLGKKYERSFDMIPLKKMGKLQQEIWTSWLHGK
jgi:predicted metalloprotease with PDZ domain